MVCRFLLVLLLLFALMAKGLAAGNPCVLASGGIGGTGAPQSGIGGTGAPIATSDPGGIGGTGVIADEGGIGGTGIVGVITGFASICVGGIEVHYAADTPVTQDGNVFPIGQLRVGHTVQVEALGLGESVRAKRIELVRAVAGPVSQVDSAHGRIEVLGQSIRVSGQFLADAVRAAREGHPVQVSGLRSANGEIFATRVDVAPELREFGVTGPLSEVTGDRARIQNLTIKLDRALARNLKKGQSVEICGRMENGSLRARTVEAVGVAAFSGKLERVIVEGFVTERKLDQVRVGDTVVRLGKDTKLSGVASRELKRDQRVVVAARMSGGRLVADSVHVVRELDRLPGHDARSNKGSREGSSDSDGRDDESSGDSNAGDSSHGSGHGSGDGSSDGSSGSSNTGSNSGAKDGGSSSGSNSGSSSGSSGGGVSNSGSSGRASSGGDRSSGGSNRDSQARSSSGSSGSSHGGSRDRASTR